MNPSCGLAEQEILARDRDILIHKGFHYIPVMLAQDAKLMQRLAAKRPNMPPLCGDSIPPFAQPLFTVDIDLIGRLCSAAARSGAIQNPVAEFRS